MNLTRRRLLSSAAAFGVAAQGGCSAQRTGSAGPCRYQPSPITGHLLSTLGLTYPLFQAPLGPGVGPALPIAVSNARGMGAVALWALSPQDAVARVKAVRSGTTKPFARKANAKFGIAVTSAESARAALDAGADYLVCQGTEAGGHVQASSRLFDALADVLKEARHVPVVAARGLAAGPDILRALSAGVAGAMLGTRFVATRECPVHEHARGAT